MNIALIFAGGIGTRMKDGSIPKQFMKYKGKSILLHTIQNFEIHKEIDAIVVVCLENYIETLKKEIESNKIKKVKWVVSGGDTGQQSIYNGLKKVYDDIANKEDIIVLVNDGVRPNLKEEIITKNIRCVKKHKSSVTVAPVSETIVEVGEDNRIYNIPIRKYSYLSKAPQGFYLKDLIKAHERAIEDNDFSLTNSAELMGKYGHPLYVVLDNDENIKITTSLDLKIWKEIIRKEE